MVFPFLTCYSLLIAVKGTVGETRALIFCPPFSIPMILIQAYNILLLLLLYIIQYLHFLLPLVILCGISLAI